MSKSIFKVFQQYLYICIRIAGSIQDIFAKKIHIFQYPYALISKVF